MTALVCCTLLAVLAGFGLSIFGLLLPCVAGLAIPALGWAVRHRMPLLLASGVGLVAGSMAYIAWGLLLNAIGSPASGSGMGL